MAEADLLGVHMKRLSLVFAVVAAQSACSGLEAYDVVPRAGTWTFYEQERRSDDCVVDDTQVEDADLELSTSITTITISEYADSGFFLSVDGSEDAWCYMEGPSFSCEPAMGTDKRMDGATITETTMASGWIEDPRFLDGDFTFALGCRGPDCRDLQEANDVESLPCEVRGSFWAEAGSPSP